MVLPVSVPDTTARPPDWIVALTIPAPAATVSVSAALTTRPVCVPLGTVTLVGSGPEDAPKTISSPPLPSLATLRDEPIDDPAKMNDWLMPPPVIVSTVLPLTIAEVSVAPPWMKVTSIASPAPKPEITAWSPTPELVALASTFSVPPDPSNVSALVKVALADCKSTRPPLMTVSTRSMLPLTLTAPPPSTVRPLATMFLTVRLILPPLSTVSSLIVAVLTTTVWVPSTRSPARRA